jgi:hypothetical protein
VLIALEPIQRDFELLAGLGISEAHGLLFESDGPLFSTLEECEPSFGMQEFACNRRHLAITKLKAGDYITNQTYNGLPFKVRCISPETFTIDGGSDDWQSEKA